MLIFVRVTIVFLIFWSLEIKDGGSKQHRHCNSTSSADPIAAPEEMYVFLGFFRKSTKAIEKLLARMAASTL